MEVLIAIATAIVGSGVIVTFTPNEGNPFESETVTT
jgi:hypothetical protein